MSEKQRIARARNWGIRKLRAYYHLCPHEMSQANRDTIRGAVDKALAALGAEPETNRYTQKLQQLEELFDASSKPSTAAKNNPGKATEQDHQAPDPDFQV